MDKCKVTPMPNSQKLAQVSSTEQVGEILILPPVACLARGIWRIRVHSPHQPAISLLVSAAAGFQLTLANVP